MQQIPIPAGGTILRVRGSFFRVEGVAGAASGASGVRVKADGVALGTLQPGEDVTLPQAASTWEVTPETATATASVRIGNGRVRSNRAFGVLNTADSPAVLTLTGTQFLGYAIKAPLVGQFAIAGLRAADLQPVPTVVSKFRIWAGATCSVTVASCTGDPGTDSLGTGPGFGANKRLGGTTSLTRRIVGGASSANPSAFELPGRQTIVFIPVPANVWVPFELETPFLLDAGFGIAAVPNAPDVSVSIIAEFQERFVL